MAQFGSSSQSKKWTYTLEQIELCKKSALTSVLSGNEEHDLQFLLKGEEAAIEYFSQQIWIIFGQIENSTPILIRKWRVPATAIMYFRRFYTKQSMIIHDPRLVMLGVIYLAAKIEENFIVLRDLMQITDKYSEGQILNIERMLLEVLDFDLKIHHPQNEVHGLLTGFRSYLHQTNVHIEDISKLAKDWNIAADKVMRELQMTKVILCCKPLHVAIFSLKSSVPLRLGNYFDAYIHHQQLGSLDVIGVEIHSISQSISQSDDLQEFIKYMKKHNKWRENNHSTL